MSKWRIGVIAGLMVLLLFVAIFFWGSVASGLSVLLLILIPGVLAFRVLWVDREDRTVDEMDPMNIIYNRHLDTVGSDKEDY